ncbi:deoxyguanosinetriphosphate triphosphohydrolase family protein [Vibrio parahaemolyticus]|nr:deoxyguanosinetriphosphate triphosphohydrolase family protein [Vibrio parahaemolyticus]
MTINWEERRKPQSQRFEDVRSEYDRDEARLIHSAAFRRLQSKTQVLGLGESDFYRTRLTHSMEVAQIGRGIVQYLAKRYKEELKAYDVGLPDTALITAICLAHDIGHPPFGHGGEVALNYCMRKHGGFEGNGQTLRILGKLDKYTDGFGLNPTRRLLLGVLKYPRPYSDLVNEESYADYDTKDKPYWLFKAKPQKPPKCFHECDQDIVKFIFDGISDTDKRKFTSYDTEGGKHSKTAYKSFDCTIMNLADNISYSLHDLEDALSLGMIARDDWLKHFKGHEKLFSSIKDCQLTFEEVTDGLFDDESFNRKNAIGSLVNLMITNTIIVENGSDCENPLLKFEVKLQDDVEKLREHIFNLVVAKVIFNEGVQQLEFKGQKLVIELFQILSTDPERFLPKTTVKSWKEKKGDESEQLRVICDFIAGMTDDYATKFYEKLMTPNKGSIFDRL